MLNSLAWRSLRTANVCCFSLALLYGLLYKQALYSSVFCLWKVALSLPANCLHHSRTLVSELPSAWTMRDCQPSAGRTFAAPPRSYTPASWSFGLVHDPCLHAVSIYPKPSFLHETGAISDTPVLSSRLFGVPMESTW